MLLLAAWFIAIDSHAQALNLPDLAQIKAEAERGDAKAQFRMGDAHKGRLDHAGAAKWYRMAAEQGDAQGQAELGAILMSGWPGFGAERLAVPANPQEGVQWLKRAAHQGHAAAQYQLGQCHETGKAVEPDIIEAYKWHSLAAQSGSIFAKDSRDKLILKMTAEQIAEGQRRVNAFKPGFVQITGTKSSPAARADALRQQLKLKAVGGTATRRIALINSQNVMVGDDEVIKTGAQPVRIRCLEIRDKSVLIAAEGVVDPIELALGE